MAALGWLLNLDFAASGAGEPPVHDIHVVASRRHRRIRKDYRDRRIRISARDRRIRSEKDDS